MDPNNYDDEEDMDDFADYNPDRYDGQEKTEGSIDDMMKHL